MFFPGARVRVICSSVKSGKTGPRINSEGFVSNHAIMRVSKGAKGWMPELAGLLIKPITIIFYKYGNDEKVRCERKKFVNLIPLTTSEKSPEEIRTFFDNFQRRITSDSLNKILSTRELDRLPGHCYHGILAPASPEALECKGELLVAWASAVTQNKSLIGSYTTEMPKLLAKGKRSYKEMLIIDLLMAATSKKIQDELLLSFKIYPNKADKLKEILTVHNSRSDMCDSQNLLEYNTAGQIEWLLRAYMIKNKTLINERIIKLGKSMMSSMRKDLKVLKVVAENITNRG